MNFFERQDIVRRQSKRLVLLFALAVFGIVAAVDVVLLALGLGSGANPIAAIVVASLCTLAVIGSASLFRIASLRTGGAAVAHQFGATPVSGDTGDFNLRRLRNVVEEIAIASGVPVPQIFVLDDEESINAFAAGYSPSDAAITVTRGALRRLNRDELQGVIAHEFSHVLNGDMRLNIRLVGLLFGIMVLALIGRKILENGRFGRKGAGAVIGTALALLVIGYVGLFFGRLIKAGISRQREYLADASAVQFTRQTRGIAGALKKLAGLGIGSKLSNGDAEEVSHMLFGDGLGFSGWMATHPPLLDRIQALEPSFKSEALKVLAKNWLATPPVGLEEDRLLGLDTLAPTALPKLQDELTVTPPGIVAQVGAPQPDDYRRAGAIAGTIPDLLEQAARSQNAVTTLLYGLLHSDDAKVRSQQQFELKARLGASVAGVALDYAGHCQHLHPMQRLPLAALAFPALRRRPRAELQQFMDTVYALMHADGRIDMFEYCLGRLLRTQVQDALDPAGAWVPGRKRLADVSRSAIVLFAVLAQAGHDDPAGAQRAFLAGMSRVFPRVNATYSPPAEGLQALEAVWPELDAVDPMGKELLIEGLVAAISSDNHIAVAEAELLRTVCGSLHCPLPPMLEQAESRLS